MLEEYRCHKHVHAELMTREDFATAFNRPLTEQDDGSMVGFHVVYDKGTDDEYHSWSPWNKFKQGYCNVNRIDMTIGAALLDLRNGKRVARKGWNGKGIYLYHVSKDAYPAKTDIAKAQIGEMVPYKEYIAMRCIDGEVVPWTASQTDILANDWITL